MFFPIDIENAEQREALIRQRPGEALMIVVIDLKLVNSSERYL